MFQGVPWIIKFNKCKRWSFRILQFNHCNFSIFIEDVFNVPFPDVRGQIAYIYLTVTTRHRFNANQIKEESLSGSVFELLGCEHGEPAVVKQNEKMMLKCNALSCRKYKNNFISLVCRDVSYPVLN